MTNPLFQISRRKKVAASFIVAGSILLTFASLLYAAVYMLQDKEPKPNGNVATSTNTANTTTTYTNNASSKQNTAKQTSTSPDPRLASPVEDKRINAQPSEKPKLTYSQCESLVSSGATSIPPECQSAYNVYQQRIQYEREREAKLRQQQARDAEQAERERQNQQNLRDYQERLKNNDYLKPKTPTQNKEDYLKRRP
jgi:hypothetical protein